MQSSAHAAKKQAGFSIMELLIAVAVMIVVSGAATTLLVSAFTVLSR